MPESERDHTPERPATARLDSSDPVETPRAARDPVPAPIRATRDPGTAAARAIREPESVETSADRETQSQRRAATAAEPASEIDLPASFGKYFLTEKLATGGMAEIYLAKIVGPGGFEKPLVIKQIHPRLSGQRHFVDLFVAEAKTLVTLAHGNIVPVYELGVIDDTYFIAMEYIDGPTLYRLTEALRRRGAPMQPPLAAWITARILEGLDYAHRKGEGVIHRDLSPRNVMLSRDGEVKLVDFGIAVTLGTTGDDASGGSAPTGSFPYMSPEQVRKQPLTVQTDLFSAGVLFWEMLVGRRLFARSDPDATLSAVVGGDIARPSAGNPDVPVKLDGVVMRALERDRAARWATAGDMLAALQRYLYSLDAPPGPRDVAALVARYCPPETRRLPTHLEALGDSDPADATQPRGIKTSPDEDPRPGPRTAVIPRDGAQPRGKPRARTETFATNVDLEHILERAALPDERDGATGPRPGQPTTVATRDSEAQEPSHPRRRSQRVISDGTEDDASTHAHVGTRELGAHESGTHAAESDRAAVLPVEAGAVPTSQPPASGGPPLTMPGQILGQVPGQRAPSRALLVMAGIGAIGLGIASVVVFYRGRDAVLQREAMLAHDAAPPVDTAKSPPADTAKSPPVDTAKSPPADTAKSPPADTAKSPPADTAKSPPADTAKSPPADTATVPATAQRPTVPRDGRVRPPRGDARTNPPATGSTDPGTPRATGTATLTVGANPWGDVLLDGKRIGRTPIERLSVPAGRHTIEVIFTGDDQPRTQRYTIDIASGEIRDVLADFTRP